MPRHRIAILAGLLVGAALVTLSMWLNGLMFLHRLEIHPGWILLLQVVGGWGILRRKGWGLAAYLGLAVFLSLPGLAAMGSDVPKPPASQISLASVLVAAVLYAWSSDQLVHARHMRFYSRH